MRIKKQSTMKLTSKQAIIELALIVDSILKEDTVQKKSIRELIQKIKG